MQVMVVKLQIYNSMKKNNKIYTDACVQGDTFVCTNEFIPECDTFFCEVLTPEEVVNEFLKSIGLLNEQ